MPIQLPPPTPHDLIFRSTQGDRFGPITAKVAEMIYHGNIVAGGNSHVAVALPSKTGHHPKHSKSAVYWTARIGPKNAVKLQRLEEIQGDFSYLNSLGQLMQAVVAEGNTVFGFHGFTPPDTQLEPSMASAPMSVDAFHLHKVPPIKESHVYGSILFNHNTTIKNRERITWFFDYAAKIIQDEISKRLDKDFSPIQHVWSQYNGLVFRMARGFNSLGEALMATVALDNNLKSVFPVVLRSLANEWGPKLTFPFIKGEENSKSLVKFPDRFSATIFMPSQEDKKLMGLAENGPPVWVSVGSRVPTSVLINGVYPERKLAEAAKK